MNMINRGFQSINKTFERSLDFRPLETGFLQLANSDEKRSVRNRISTIGAAATLPFDRVIGVVATPIITVIDHIRDIKQSKGLKKGVKFVATIIWIPIKAALKTAAFALYAFVRLPYDIFKAIQGVRTESPIALKREYTGRLKETVLQRYQKSKTEDKAVTRKENGKEVNASYHQSQLFPKTAVFSCGERGKALIHAIKEAQIKETTFESIYVVSIGKSGMADSIDDFNAKKPLRMEKEHLEAIPELERSKKILVIFQSIDQGLEAKQKKDAEMVGWWQTAFEAPGENIAYMFPQKLNGIPVGSSLYFMGQTETNNLPYGILPKNLELAVKQKTA